MCPDKDSFSQPFDLWVALQSTEPHQPELTFIIQIASFENERDALTKHFGKIRINKNCPGKPDAYLF